MIRAKLSSDGPCKTRRSKASGVRTIRTVTSPSPRGSAVSTAGGCQLHYGDVGDVVGDDGDVNFGDAYAVVRGGWSNREG